MELYCASRSCKLSSAATRTEDMFVAKIMGSCVIQFESASSAPFAALRSFGATIEARSTFQTNPNQPPPPPPPLQKARLTPLSFLSFWVTKIGVNMASHHNENSLQTFLFTSESVNEGAPMADLVLKWLRLGVESCRHRCGLIWGISDSLATYPGNAPYVADLAIHPTTIPICLLFAFCRPPRQALRSGKLK